MKNERDFYRDSETVTRSAESGAAVAVGKDGKKRIRLIIRIAVLVTVGSLLLCELFGLRFIERLAICDARCACDHWSEVHSQFTEFHPCHGVMLETDDYDFFFAYDNDSNGDPCTAYMMLGVKRFGLMYHEAAFDSWDMLYDDSDEPAFNLITFKGRDKNYYFIDWLWRDVRMVDDGDLQSWREYLHRCERITVNWESVDLYLMSYFVYAGEIDTIVLSDGTVVHPKTCRREEPQFGSLPSEVRTMPAAETQSAD